MASSDSLHSMSTSVTKRVARSTWSGALKGDRRAATSGEPCSTCTSVRAASATKFSKRVHQLSRV